MDGSIPRLMHTYGPTAVSRPPHCHIDTGIIIDDGDVYGSVAGGGPGASSASLAMPNCLNGGASPRIADSGSGLVVEPGMGMSDAEGHHFRAGFQSQQSSSSFHRNQQLQQQQQQQQVHIGATTARTLGSASPKPIRRRMRMITSCLECRRRKLKCNKSNPCTNCLRFSRDCFYLGPKLDEASQLRLTEIKEKVGSLERQLERDVAKSGGRGFYPQRILADDIEEDYDEERDLEITPMVALDLTYEDDADGMDDIMDLGVQVGKMRLTEKIGGLNRPRISEEVRVFSPPPCVLPKLCIVVLTCNTRYAPVYLVVNLNDPFRAAQFPDWTLGRWASLQTSIRLLPALISPCRTFYGPVLRTYHPRAGCSLAK